MFPADVVVLGPQRLAPNLGAAIDDILPPESRENFAIVTAGWEERESEDQELDEHLGGRTTNLNLFERAEDVFRRDPELLEAMLLHYARRTELQKLYRIRLAHALDAARALLRVDRVDTDSSFVENARAEAIQDVRRLDADHLETLRALHDDHQREWRPQDRESVAKHRAEIEGVLAGSNALCIAGGHVVILLNRLRLFGLMELVGDRPILCWSAGAMALTDRIVVFHDSPPQGAGDAEVLEAGIGFLDGIVPLPHARHRLQLDDPVRVELFARRFGPSSCVALDEGARIEWDGKRWKPGDETRCLQEDGRVEVMTQ